MPILYERLVRSRLSAQELAELSKVDDLAKQLLDHLSAKSADFDRAHQHGASSSVIQVLVSAMLVDNLQFSEEVVIHPADGLVTRARPDFFYATAEGRGVIAEVERGGTTTNNHDLKDLWKAHISPRAQHLFLIVPNANWHGDGKAREKPFRSVTRRMRSFFGDERREVDVVSVHVYGYGRPDVAFIEAPVRATTDSRRRTADAP